MGIKKPLPQDFEEIVIELKHKMITLQILPFDTDINVDEVLKIDFSNILGEILTFNVLFNRVANLKAEMENIVSVSKMNLEVFEAQKIKEVRKFLTKDGGKATESQIDAEVKTCSEYRIIKEAHFEKIKNLGYCESMYWSAQNKSGLLRSLSDKLRPEEFMGELLTDTINGVMIKASKKAIS